MINSSLSSCTLIICITHSLRNPSWIMGTLSQFWGLPLVQWITLWMGAYMHFHYVHCPMYTLQILCEHINIHHLVKPWYHTISVFILNIPENHLRRKLLDRIFQTKYSRFLWIKITFNVMNLTSHGRDHAERSVPSYPESLIVLFIILKFIYVLISLVPNSLSFAIVKDPFARHFKSVNNYFYILC